MNRVQDAIGGGIMGVPRGNTSGINSGSETREARRHAMRQRAYHRTHQTHATTTASQMMKA